MAATPLVDKKDPGAIKFLKNIIVGDNDGAIRKKAVDAFTQIEDEMMAEMLDKGIKDDGQVIRYLTAFAP